MPTLLDNLEVRGINLAGEEIARVCLNKQDSRTCKQKRSVATRSTSLKGGGIVGFYSGSVGHSRAADQQGTYNATLS